MPWWGWLIAGGVVFIGLVYLTVFLIMGKAMRRLLG